MKPSLDDKAEPDKGLRRGQFTIGSLFLLTTLVAVVCGLATWHGSGVLLVILWNATAALIALAVGRTKRKAAAASLFSLFAGWCAAFVLLVVWQVHATDFGEIIDFDFWFHGTAIFAFLGWVVFVVPVINFARADGLLYRPLVATIVGVGLAMVAYAVLVCTWAPEMGNDAWFPAVIGGVAGILCPLLAPSRCAAYLLFAGPSLSPPPDANGRGFSHFPHTPLGAQRVMNLRGAAEECI